jgi:hypothetical protein
LRDIWNPFIFLGKITLKLSHARKVGLYARVECRISHGNRCCRVAERRDESEGNGDRDAGDRGAGDRGAGDRGAGDRGAGDRGERKR